MKALLKKIAVVILVLLVAAGMVLSMLPLPASAAEFSVAGWIPYWSKSKGPHEARKNIEHFDVLYPFAFVIKSDGTIEDLAKLKGSSWKKLFSTARKNDTLVVPTVMTSNTELVHTLLSNATLREKHIDAIVAMVDKGDFDGVDIDYEGKKAATKNYFSLFLKELKSALGNKMLSCTIEARTPPYSLYRTVPETIAYANDLPSINTHCDRVNVMAYDQQRADLKLNDARKGAPYIPVADSEWVRKVIEFMAKDIDKEKLVLGIPTYGAEWELTVAPEWYKEYKKLWSLNPEYADALLSDLKQKPVRNAAGELSFTYFPDGVSVPKSYKAPKGTPKGYEAAARALVYANATGQTTKVNVLWWSDAHAIREKIELAQEFGLSGVSIFKIDGGADKGIWKIL